MVNPHSHKEGIRIFFPFLGWISHCRPENRKLVDSADNKSVWAVAQVSPPCDVAEVKGATRIVGE